MAILIYTEITTLNVNGLNASTKRHRLDEQIQNQNLYIYCLQKTHFKSRDIYSLKVRDGKKVFHANGNQKKAGIATLISDKVQFKIKTITRDEHYVMIKGQIKEEYVTTTNYMHPAQEHANI